jgi:hypothetical protein
MGYAEHRETRTRTPYQVWRHNMMMMAQVTILQMNTNALITLVS